MKNSVNPRPPVLSTEIMELDNDKQSILIKLLPETFFWGYDEWNRGGVRGRKDPSLWARGLIWLVFSSGEGHEGH